MSRCARWLLPLHTGIAGRARRWIVFLASVAIALIALYSLPAWWQPWSVVLIQTSPLFFAFVLWRQWLDAEASLAERRHTT
jgi:hypothetical protein